MLSVHRVLFGRFPSLFELCFKALAILAEEFPLCASCNFRIQFQRKFAIRSRYYFIQQAMFVDYYFGVFQSEFLLVFYLSFIIHVIVYFVKLLRKFF